MLKGIKRITILIFVSVVVIVTLVACKSKRVKDNEYTTSKEYVYIPQEYEVDDELKFELYGIGKNIIRVDLSKPEIEKIYEEREQLDCDKTAGNEIDKSYRYEMEVLLKQDGEIKFTIRANKLGTFITSTDKMSDGKYVNQERGYSDNYWIYKKKIIEMQILHPGVVEAVKACDTYEVHFIDKETGERVAFHSDDNKVDNPFPMSGPSYMEKMLFDLDIRDENTIFVSMRCFGFSGVDKKKVLITLGENEDKYIMLEQIKSVSEIETIDVLYHDDDYNSEEFNINASVQPVYKMELGDIKYDEDGKREFIPMLGESGNPFNVPVINNCFLIKREGIKDFFDGCTMYRGYIGEEFDELVYLVIK